MLAKITGNKMILGAVVGIVGGLIVAVLFLVVLAPKPTTAETGAAATTGAAAKATPPKTAAKAGQPPEPAGGLSGLNYIIKDRIVNLADPGGRRYLRFTIALEFAQKVVAIHGNQLALYEPGVDAPGYQLTSGTTVDPDKEFQIRIKKFAPALEDIVMTVLSSKTSGDLSSLEGKDATKKEIKDRVQRIVGDEEHITNVYFVEFVMQ